MVSGEGNLIRDDQTDFAMFLLLTHLLVIQQLLRSFSILHDIQGQK